MKIRPVGAELFHADRRTDRHDKSNSRALKFCERAEKLLDSEEERTKTFRNVGNCSPKDTTSHPRRFGPATTAPGGAYI